MSQDAYSPLKAAWHTERIEKMRKGLPVAPAQCHFIISDLSTTIVTSALTALTVVLAYATIQQERANRAERLSWGYAPRQHG